MKQDTLRKLEQFKALLTDLRRQVSGIRGERVQSIALRKAAEAIADKWVEDLRSPLEHKFKLPDETIQSTSECMKRLHVLSRPNNRKTSYLSVLNEVLNRFDDKFILPLKQTTMNVESVLDLEKLVPGLADQGESDYLRESIRCAEAGYRRASVVMGWCAAIDRIQKKVMENGLDKFNEESLRLKGQSTGKFKNWNKGVTASNLSELQSIFDTDLIIVLEGMDLLDGNQAERLRTCFQYRNHSAHPGEAPIEDPHLIVFFTDIYAIILNNPTFTLSVPL